MKLERFRREARAASNFENPNLCRVDKYDQVDGTYYLTMPYLAGRSLADCLERGDTLPQRSVGTLHVHSRGGHGIIGRGINHGGDTEWTEVSVDFEAPDGGLTHLCAFFVGFGKRDQHGVV